MQLEWSDDELIACWTLVDDDWRRLANKSGATRLGFALMLKFFELEGRFPADVTELPERAVDYVAELVKVDVSELASYGWSGRTIKYHRTQIREALGFRVCTEGDQDKLAVWLAEEVCPGELNRDRLRDAVLARCRADRIEPPSPGQLGRVVGSAVTSFEVRFCAEITRRLPVGCADLLEDLAVSDESADAEGMLAELKADPGKLGLRTLLEEVAKLERVRGLGLPGDLFDGHSEKAVAAWRARAAKSYPSDLRAAPQGRRLTLLAALCHLRATELLDSLVDLLIALVHKINARAERRVEGELFKEFKAVHGKTGILFRIAEACVEAPDGTVREVVFPAAGEATLRDLVREAKANDTAFRQRVRTVLSSSYSAHYRRMLPHVLGALDLRCNNTAYRPVVDAVELLRRYADRRTRFYDPAERVPLDDVVRRDWRDAVVDERGQVERVGYELCVLTALRDGIRRREIWVAGANRWRNPEDDLPADFEDNRDIHYAAIRQPQDPTEFIDSLKAGMRRSLATLADALTQGTAGGVRPTTRGGQPWITVPKLDKLPEATNLAALKTEVERRWGTIDLIDVLKEADHLTGFTAEFTSVGSREVLDRATLRRRLLLCLFALGTNMGVRRLASGGEHGETEAALRHTLRMYVTRDNLRAASTRLVNATLASRDQAWWGEGTACASDSKKFGSWSSNLMTEYHVRYGGTA